MSLVRDIVMPCRDNTSGIFLTAYINKYNQQPMRSSNFHWCMTFTVAGRSGRLSGSGGVRALGFMMRCRATGVYLR